MTPKKVSESKQVSTISTREKERDRQTERERDRQTDRQKEGERERERERDYLVLMCEIQTLRLTDYKHMSPVLYELKVFRTTEKD